MAKLCKKCILEKPFSSEAKRDSKASGFRGAICWACYLVIKQPKTLLWSQNNRDKARAASSNWCKANKEARNVASLLWWRVHPEYNVIHSHNYHAKKRANGGKLSKNIHAIKLEEQKGLCAWCQKELGNDQSLDHKIPISLGGPNIDSNIQLLHKRCNSSKGAQHAS